MQKITKDEAIRILSDAEGDRRFFVNDGNVISNLSQVTSTLKKMKKETFEHHVNTERNDFANWINDVLGDSELAAKLRKIKKRTDMTKKVSERISALKKVAS